MVTFSCQDYLGRVLPLLLDKGPFAALPSPVTVQFVIEDEPGADAYLTLAPVGAKATSGRAKDADVSLAFSRNDLIAFSKGELDMAAAVRTGRVKITGNEDVLGLLIAALQH